jgi:hypothetical protein
MPGNQTCEVLDGDATSPTRPHVRQFATALHIAHKPHGRLKDERGLVRRDPRAWTCAAPIKVVKVGPDRRAVGNAHSPSLNARGRNSQLL